MKLHRPCKAFTLIEMAIVLIIIGILVGLIAPIVTDVVKREKTGNARDYVEQVRDEIVGFALINKRLPTAAELGTKIDVFGNTLIYHPSTEMTAQDFCSINPSDLYTVTEQLAPSGTNTYSGIAFVIASPGRDLTQQFTVAGTAVGTYDPRAWTPIAGQDEYDDIVEFVSFNYLKNKVCTNISENSDPNGADTTFAQDIADVTGAASGVAPPGSASGDVTVDTTQNSIALGANSPGGTYGSGCVWYQGTTGPCTDGVCFWNNGFRAYFQFATGNDDSTDSDSTDYGDGFTFAIMTADSADNGPGVCGAHGSYLGYGGTSASTGAQNSAATVNGITPPKIALEFDFYASGFNDPPNNYNHLAVDYWANIRNNDTYHASAIINPASLSPAQNPSTLGSGLFYPSAGDYRNYNAWMEDTRVWSVRIEVDSSVPDRYTLEAWVKQCDGAGEDCTGLDDLTTDFTGTQAPDLTQTLIVPAGISPSFDRYYFGWTQGDGGVSQQISIFNFGIKFL